MSTRKAADNAPLSQERYMSSPDYAALRGISAVATAARTALLPPANKRTLIWWIQGKSLAECGLRQFASELIEAFPERISDAEQARRCGPKALNLYGEPVGDKSVEEFLIDLCINPRLMFAQSHKKEDWTPGDEMGMEMAKNRFRELDDCSFRPAQLPYFKNIISALLEFQQREQKAIKEKFVLTAIGRQVWETLDYALATRSMVLLDGLEGRGKTEAVKAWCALHLGEARFVTLKGINNKTTAFREIGKALGIVGAGYKSTELQARIEDVLQRSKLMLILDEAHFIFNQGNRIYTRPELADWIHTLCNRGIPIALVTTPQFMICLTRANKHVDWNYRQFRRRVRRYVKLPPKNTPRDVEAVIRAVLPGAPNSAVKQVMAFVHLTKRDLSAVGDVVDEIKAIQECEQLTKVTYEEIVRVIDEHLVPSEKNFEEAFTAAEEKISPRLSKRSRPSAPVEATEADGPGAETEDAREAAGERPRNNFSVTRETQSSRLPSLLNTI